MSVQDLTLEAKATRWGEAVTAAAMRQRPIDYIANSTYNEYLDVLPNAHFETEKVPVINWVGLGIGSKYMSSIVHPLNSAVIDNPAYYIHSNEDAIPFIPFPYVMRKVGSDDLSTTERARYAMRAIIVIEGVQYVAYYLKAAEATSDKVAITVVETDGSGNLVDTNPLEPSTAPLNPKRDSSYLGESTSSNEYLQVRAPLTLSLTSSDISEILNCAAIMFGETDIEITEFSMVAGISYDNTVTDGGSNISYSEVIAAQSTHFSPVGFSAAQRLDVGIDIEFRLGQSMSMS